MNRYLFLIVIALSFKAPAQVNKLMELKKDAYEKEIVRLREGHGGTRKKGIGNALLTFYQKRISALISADCIYQLSCSKFAREAVNKKGLFAGVLLSADRLSRCSYLCSKDIPEFKFNQDGLAEDHP